VTESNGCLDKRGAGFDAGHERRPEAAIPPAVLKAKAQAVLDERDKLDINRDLMEKMQHEGI
jgi:hypothetical protein